MSSVWQRWFYRIRRLRCHLRVRSLPKRQRLGLGGKPRGKLLDRVNRRETWSCSRGKRTSSPSPRGSRMSCSGPGHTTQSTMIRAERKSCFPDTWLGAIENFFRWEPSRPVQISSCFCLVRMVILFLWNSSPVGGSRKCTVNLSKKTPLF